MAHDVEVTFDGELSELKSSLDSMHSEIRGWGDSVRAIGVGAFLAWASTQAFDVLKAGLSEVLSLTKEFIGIAQEAAQIDAQLATAVESTGRSAGFTADELSNLADNLQKFTTFGDEAIKTAETMLLQFRNLKGDEFKRATELALDMATRMGGDASSAASQLGKALNDPIRGMMLLERQGITLSDAQQNVIKSLTASGQTAQAQGILLDELAKLYGGAAEAAANASGGGFKQLAEIIDNIKEAIGAKLLPVLDDLAPAFKFEAQEIGAEIVALIDSFMNLGSSITDSFGTSAAEKFVGAIAVMRQELELVIGHLKVWIAYSIRAAEIAANPTTALPTGGRATDAERALDRAKENLSSLQERDPLEAANAAIERFRAAVKKEQQEHDAREKQRDENRNKKSESQIDPNILAFTKAFPNATATFDGLKSFGAELGGMASKAAGQAGEVAAAIGKPLRETFQDVVDPIKGMFKKDDGFKSGFESLTGLFARIQGAAASTEAKREERKVELAEKTATATHASMGFLQSIATGISEIAKNPGGVAKLG